jgi:hypothetical protein
MIPVSFRFSRWISLAGIGGLLLIIGLLVIAYSLHSKKQPSAYTTNQTTSVSEQTATDLDVKRVFIKDFYKYGDYFTPEKQRAIENALYYYAGQGKPDLYTGVIRPGSFSQAKDSTGAVNTKLLVDISPVNITYILGVTGTTKDGPKPVLIQCAPKDQQQNSSVSCSDGMQTRE